MKFRMKLGVLAVGVLLSYFAWAKLTSSRGDQKVTYVPSKKECFTGGPERSYKYCIHTPADGKTNGNIAYLLHGRNLDENTWNDDTFYTAMVQQYWTEHKLIPPTVVTVSFGPVWLIVPEGKQEKSGLLEVFVQNVIPTVEQRLEKPIKRIVFGESMGGLNSLVLGLTQGNLFQKVASLCPAVYLGSPFSSVSDLKSFIDRTGADPKIIYGIVQLSKDYLADGEEWNASSPVALIEKADPENSPVMYLSCGLYDAYGNFEGNEHLAKRATERGFKISWHPLYGGHCATDITSLAQFLGE